MNSVPEDLCWEFVFTIIFSIKCLIKLIKSLSSISLVVSGYYRMGLADIAVGLPLFTKSFSASVIRSVCIFNPIACFSGGLVRFSREDLGLDELGTSVS